MALKFLNKKGWHTGSLRNIENVWKAEQKHESEQKKLEELRKQIQEERERSEFRLLQEQAGLVPKQERLDFLYDSGLAVGKGSSSGFKALESYPKTDSDTVSSSSAKQQQQSVPGALFEEKPHSANDTWRKLHSDPLLLIRQREQEALARVKNNPVQMAMIRKSFEAKNHKEKTPDAKDVHKKHHHKKSKHSSSKYHSDSDNVAVKREERTKPNERKRSKYDDSEEEAREAGIWKKKNTNKDLKYKERPRALMSDLESEKNEGQCRIKTNHDKTRHEKCHLEGRVDSNYAKKEREERKFRQPSVSSDMALPQRESQNKRRKPIKLSEEERATRLREMQMDAELHEEHRWKRLKKAEENDAQEVIGAGMSGGRNFLDAAKKSAYGAEKGGSSTIEESVRRRTHYLQGRSEANEGNAFRR